MSHGDERVSGAPARSPEESDRRGGGSWLTAGEIVAVVVLALGVAALIVALQAPAMSGSYRDLAGALIGLLLVLGATASVILATRARRRAAERADLVARELAEARRQIDRLNATLRARDELLLTVVHELRTPLTHVAGYAELLSSGVRPRRPDEIGEMSAAIQSASTTMLRLMDDLVEMTRLQSAGFGLKARPVDLVPLIRGTIVGFEVQGHRHRLIVDLPDHWLTALADPERVRQVLANLLTNAISYSPDGGEIRVRARQIDGEIRVEVEDHGIGLAPEDLNRVFDRFYRGSRGRALREHGSGLGLAVVKDLVEAHGGRVGVHSRVGVGSTFWFTLRAADEVVGGAEPMLPSPTRATASPAV